jgi:hypothetical protein
MSAIVLTDLDGVHINARHRCPEGAALMPAAYNAAGRATSFMTEKQKTLLAHLLARALVIPVTARPAESLKRVAVDFTSHAICSFGGLILLPDGSVDPTWQRLMHAECAAYRGELSQLKDLLEQSAFARSTGLKATVVCEHGLDLYLNCKVESGGAISELATMGGLVKAVLPPDWTLHSNGNNAALLPPFLSKRRAAHYYLSELAPQHSCVVGLGDSFTDLEFIELCDYFAAPTDSQVFGWWRCFDPQT